MAKVAVTFLNADFGHLQEQIDKVSNADEIHFDIMDGHFVPNISYGWKLMSDIKTNLKKVVHLMIENPEKYLDRFIDAGAQMIIVHLEACENLDSIINYLRERKIEVGIAINPDTKIHWIRYYLDKVDMILIMTANPGFGGQPFQYNMLDKIDELRQESSISIGVDCGINNETGKLCVLAGADVLISGTYVFGSKDPRETVEILKKL
jgi:ribulose-phosphate 3-epimerase